MVFLKFMTKLYPNFLKNLVAMKNFYISRVLSLMFFVCCLTANAQDFNFTITDANMTVQVDVDVMNPIMDNGDLLGAFFTNGDGDLQNAGFSIFEGDQLAIAVWASEAGVGNGFAAGEEIQWIMYDDSEGSAVFLDAEMNTSPPFSGTFVANGFGQITSLAEQQDTGSADCADDDTGAGVAGFGGCVAAVGLLGCDFTFTDGTSITDYCPVTCDNCPSVCADDDTAAGVAGFGGCTAAVGLLGCDFTFTDGTSITDYCPVTCDNCPSDCADDDTAAGVAGFGGCAAAVGLLGCDFTFTDGTSVTDYCPVTCNSCVSGPVLGCTDPGATNYDSSATEDDSSCTYPEPGPMDFVITDANMTVQVSASAISLNGSTPPAGSVLGAYYTNDSGDLLNAGNTTLDGSDQYAVAVWASEAGLDNGFAAGEEITWVLGVGGDLFIADQVSMVDAPPFSATFVANGFGQITDVQFSGDITIDVPGCTDGTACNYDDSATSDDSSCTYAANGYNCDGACLADADGDGVCDEFEVVGCQDNTACNYDDSATDAGSCDYADAGYNCDGACLADADGDGVCDEFEVVGCQDNTACNYDDSATDAGSCDYADAGYNCDGGCLVDADGDGVCDEFEVVGCQDNAACNYDDSATDAGSCDYADAGYNCDGACLADADGDGVCDEFEVVGCQDNTACNYDDSATDAGSCDYADAGYNCDGACLADADGDGVCDEFEVVGCQDNTACNYDDSATDAGSCDYADAGYNCDGGCLVDADGDGVCDEFEVVGCQDNAACNYDDSATDAGSCDYADAGYNCDGACLADADGDGVCDEFEVVGCQDNTACNYDDSATDAGSCDYADAGYNCDGACLADADGDGVCDEFETGGCTDSFASNYDSTATDNDGSCEYDCFPVTIDFSWDAYVNENTWSLTEMGSADSSILSGNPAVAINAGGIATSSLTSFSYCLEPVASGVYILDISDSFGDGVISGSATITGASDLYPSEDLDFSFDNTQIYFAVGGNSVNSGCMDQSALNYDENSIVDDGSCEYAEVAGPENWTYENTGSHHLIALWPGAIFMADGSPLPAGSHIGVFYAGDNGNWVCAGSTVWNGSVGVITAMGNNPLYSNVDEDGVQTPGDCVDDDGNPIDCGKNGFDEGEIMHFRVWSPLSEGCEYTDASNLMWMDVDGMMITHQETFSTDGTSGLLGFTIENLSVSESHSSYTGYGVSCNGASDGFIDLTVTGGTAPYSYIWSNGEITESISGLSAGIYSVTVVDVNSCTVSAEVEITESPEMTISETHSNYNGFGVSTFGATNGEIDITVEGGTGSYTFDWSNGETTEDLSDLAAGTYSVTVTDQNECSVSIEVTLTSPDELLISETHSNFYGYGVTCSGATDGFIDVTVSGGAGIITYLWSNGETTQDLDGLAAGIYSVTATDENENSVSISVEITQSEEMGVSLTTTDYFGYGVSCNGLSDGAITATVTGGTGVYTYTWSNGETTYDISGIAAGTYSVTAVDENGCEVSMSVEITESEEMGISGTTLNYFGYGVSCNGLSDGAIDVTVTGGTGVYTYTWSNGETTDDISGLAAGTYSVTAADENGCEVSMSFEIIESEEMGISLTTTDYFGYGVSCNGLSDGAITATVTGGTGVYTYTWSNGETTSDISGLAAGTYSVTAADENGCTVSMSFDIMEPDAMEISVSTSGYTGYGVSCNGASDGFIDVTVTGGTGVYTYFWLNGAFDGSTLEDLTDVPAGLYEVVATDENGCQVSEVVLINEPEAMEIAGITSNHTGYGVSCNGAFDGTIDVTVSGGTGVYSYEWSNGDSTENVSGLGAGSYSVTVTDQNSCFVSMSFEITQPDALEINVSTEDYTGYGVSCNGAFDGAIDIAVTGGAGSYSYNWTDGSVVMPIGWPESLNPLELFDGIGTETNSSMMINLQSEEIIVGDSPIQTGDLIGMFYESNGEFVCSGFIVWDSQSMPPAALTILGGGDGFGFDEGQEMHMFIYDSSTGISYSAENSWNTGGVFGWNDSGLYSGDSFYQTLAMSVTEYVGGVSISDAEDVSNLGAGTYSVIVTDENGCAVSAEVEITESPEMTISETHSNYNGFGVSTFGATNGEIDITVEGGTGSYTFDWSNGETTEDLSDLAAGTYSVTVTDQNECSVFIEVTLTSPDELLISETHSNFNGYGVTCSGATDGFIDVTVSGGAGIITYSWSNGETTQDLDGLAAGIYSVTATDENENSVSISVEITESEEMAIDGSSYVYAGGYGVSCNGASDGVIDVTVSGGTGVYSYFWSLDSEATSNLSSLSFDELSTLASSNGIDPADAAVAISNGLPMSGGDWLSGMPAGTYSVTATDENGCSVSMSFEITESDLMEISGTTLDYVGYGVSCNGGSDGAIDVTVIGGTGVYTYLWSNGETTADISGLVAGSYSVTATDENGCEVSMSFEITESPEMTISEVHSSYAGYGVSCNGASDGFIDITVLGGTGIYSFEWSNGAFSEDISNLTAGTYSVTATDQNGCSVSIDVIITETDEMTISEVHSDYTGFGVSCNGSTDGFIDITVEGGTGLYVYDWSNGETTEDLNSIGAGIYSVTVTDQNGCSVSIDVNITEADEMILAVDGVVPGPHILGDIAAGSGSVNITVAGGTGIYSFDWSSTLIDGSSYLSSDEDLVNLFAGTYSVIVTDQNGCSVSQDVTVPFITPSEWSVIETAFFHEIEVPSDASITIDFDAITYGDYIAVGSGVEVNELGQMLSGSIGGMIMWNGSFDVLNAYNSVFSNGDVFEWMIWDASTGMYYSADAVYDADYPNTDSFEVGGLSHVIDIVARTVFAQSIELPAGWGIYSTFISPADGSLETVLSDVVDNLIIMKDENGAVYWPLLGMNFIGSLTDGEGYQIKMGAGDLLDISGDLIPSDFEMFMSEGWSYIAYLHQDAGGAESMMQPLSDNLVILKDGAGSVYWPFIGVNALDGGSGLMKPGLGYQIKVSENATFSYPEMDGASRFALNPTPIYPLTKYATSTNTGSNMTIGIPVNAWDVVPEDGDEIAAYTESGKLVGSVTYTGSATALTVWGDDATTDEVEGLIEGERVTFELWRKSENRVELLEVKDWTEGNNVYTENGIAVAGNITTLVEGLGYELYPNVPNPFSSLTSVSFFAPKSGEVVIGIYDMLGNLVKELTNATYDTGMYKLDFRSDDVAPGTYFMRMTASGYSVTNTINVVK